MSEPETFGMLLRQYRLAVSLSQEALGERAGLSATAIAALERGRRKTPRPSTVLLLAEGLNLALAERERLIGAVRIAQATAPPDLVGVLPRVPVPLSSFVGREQEIAEVRGILGSTRLLTLTGAAGVGKTRLALEVVSDAEDEVTFVELAPLADGGLVLQSVASALDVQEQPQRSLLQSLASALRARRLLLVLDNCEHLLPACADLASTLLRACPQLRLLTTSREPLNIDGEAVWPVPALSLPDLQVPSASGQLVESEAVRLFVERACAVNRAFGLTEQNARAVAEVCIDLDGMPLAIELAAARVRAFRTGANCCPPECSLPLVSRSAAAARQGRHQSLQAAIDWSYDLLGVGEQLLLDRLAVFAGGWTLEAAESRLRWGGHRGRRRAEPAQSAGGQVARGSGTRYRRRVALSPVGDDPRVRRRAPGTSRGKGRTVPAPSRLVSRPGRAGATRILASHGSRRLVGAVDTGAGQLPGRPPLLSGAWRAGARPAANLRAMGAMVLPGSVDGGSGLDHAAV